MASRNSNPDELPHSQSPVTTVLHSQCNRKIELEAFDNTKIGVKGLVDSGVEQIPKIFKGKDTDFSSLELNQSRKVTIPVIDLESIRFDDARKRIVEEIGRGCEEWGFFQVVNHGVPVSVLDGMIDGVRRFHELDNEVKRSLYSREGSRKFKYYSNFDLYKSPVANWRDTFHCAMAPVQPEPEDVPEVCRNILFEYTEEVKKLGTTLLELFSEALGLRSDHLKEMDCGEMLFVVGHYYPACPEPELAIGTSSHSDADFFTVLLQDGTGGLQVLRDTHWVDVPHCPGALVMNVGDLLQLITNDRFKSVNHRVVAKGTGPTMSVASFFRTHMKSLDESRLYGPIEELVTDEKPPMYKETTITEYVTCYYNKGLDGTSALPHFKLRQEKLL